MTMKVMVSKFPETYSYIDVIIALAAIVIVAKLLLDDFPDPYSMNNVVE